MGMNLKSVVLAATSVVAIAGFSAPVASAQSGDARPPQNRAQCKKFLKIVDSAAIRENKTYNKQVAKLEKRRASLNTKATTLGSQQAEVERRMTAINSALENQANPLSDEDQNRLVDEYNSLIPTSEQNVRDIQDITDELDGLKFESSQLKKNHTVNVRSTAKYRKQVVTYCKRFK
jgi:predicted  nucleic acid-binding Zn-ribbon protein